MDLIPPGLIVARYFATEQAMIEALQADQETAAPAIWRNLSKKHMGEEGFAAGRRQRQRQGH